VSVPVVPDEPTARAWLEEELRDPAYAQAQPGLLERAWDALREALAQAEGPVSPLLLLVLVAVVVGVLALVLWRTGPLRAGARTGTAGAGEIGLEEHVTAAGYRARADEAAAAGDWRTAVLDRFRALVRGLEERTVLDPRPGRTADEAAREAGLLLPAAAAGLGEAARVFDDVAYGDRTATAAHHDRVREADEAASRARLEVSA
jgi:hypothetical protein